MSAQAPGLWPHAGSPFHAASLKIQQQLGIAERLDVQGRRGVGASLTPQHQQFFPQLPFVVAASTDVTGQPWATLLFGKPGFIAADTPASLRVQAMPAPGDPLAASLVAGAAVGLLGIDLETRRRNRVNGHIACASTNGFTLDVEQAFGNCPKYIQRRSPQAVTRQIHPSQQLTALDEPARRLIAAADTLFIGTAHAAGVEVSHRGGKPGFVRIDADGSLTLPDFVGNGHFRTLGNVIAEPRAGLLFVDFSSGDMLHVAVRIELIWDGDELRSFAGAQRLLRCRVVRAIRRSGASPLSFDAAEPSSLVAATGHWPDVPPPEVSATQDDDTDRR